MNQVFVDGALLSAIANAETPSRRIAAPMADDTVDTAELARMLGHQREWLERRGRLDKLYAEGMPRPLSMSGRRRWNRGSIEAWVRRHHPGNGDRRPPPATNEDWSSAVTSHYQDPTRHRK